MPDYVISNHGQRLASTEFTNFAAKYRPYHSQGNGEADTSVNILELLLKKQCPIRSTHQDKGEFADQFASCRKMDCFVLVGMCAKIW